MNRIYFNSRSLLLCLIILCFIVIRPKLSIDIIQFKQQFTINPAIFNIRNPYQTEVIRNRSKHFEHKEEFQSIPKIIHQIWNDELIPRQFHNNIKGLVAHNRPPDWIYFFWTTDSGEKLIRNRFPRLLYRYLKASNLLKADILRLAVLYEYGGVYFDLDTTSVQTLDPYVESHDCSLVTDPPEHVLDPERPKPTLLITNSAILCKPGHWFIAYIIRQLMNQSVTCKDAVECTGPRFITKHYERIQGTLKSGNLPVIEDYRLFQDMVDKNQHKSLRKHCVNNFANLTYEWTREVCRGWIARGMEKRNISEKAFTFHTWFHTYMFPRTLQIASKKNITKLVGNVTFYNG